MMRAKCRGHRSLRWRTSHVAPIAERKSFVAKVIKSTIFPHGFTEQVLLQHNWLVTAFVKACPYLYICPLPGLSFRECCIWIPLHCCRLHCLLGVAQRQETCSSKVCCLLEALGGSSRPAEATAAAAVAAVCKPP